MNWTKLEEYFKKEITDRGDEIDPGKDQDWFSLTVGWAVAKGLSPDDAWKFATHIRYETKLA